MSLVGVMLLIADCSFQFAERGTFPSLEAAGSTSVAFESVHEPYVDTVSLTTTAGTFMVFDSPGHMHYTICHPEWVIDLVFRLFRSGGT